jgi:hypothetical protein
MEIQWQMATSLKWSREQRRHWWGWGREKAPEQPAVSWREAEVVVGVGERQGQLSGVGGREGVDYPTGISYLPFLWRE